MPRQHVQAVGDLADDPQVVSDEDVADAEVLAQLVEQVEDLGLNRDIECRHRLVAHDQLRPERQRARDRDALALSAGERSRLARLRSRVRVVRARGGRSPGSWRPLAQRALHRIRSYLRPRVGTRPSGTHLSALRIRCHRHPAFGRRIPDLFGAKRAATMSLILVASGLLVIAGYDALPGLFLGTAILAAGHALAFPADVPGFSPLLGRRAKLGRRHDRRRVESRDWRRRHPLGKRSLVDGIPDDVRCRCVSSHRWPHAAAAPLNGFDGATGRARNSAGGRGLRCSGGAFG